MKTAITLFIGALIGLAIPLLCDWLLFGTLTPCRTIPDAQYFNALGAPQQEYSNIIVQECETK